MDSPLWQTRFGDHLAARGMSPRTVEGYVGEARALLRYLEPFGLSSPCGITKDMLDRYRDHLHELRFRGRPLTLASKASRLGAVKAFMAFLLRERYILYNPATTLERPRVPRYGFARVLFTEEEVAKLLEAPDVTQPLGLRDRAVLEMLYGTGMRNSELTGIELDDVYAKRRELRVRAAKGARQRIVPLGDEALYWVERYLQDGRPHLVRDAVLVRLFVSSRGTALSREVATEVVSRYGQAAGLSRRITPHVLRHCCATHMLARGAGLRHLQELLGHASLLTTQLYTRVELSDLRQAHRRFHPREKGARS